MRIAGILVLFIVFLGRLNAQGKGQSDSVKIKMRSFSDGYDGKEISVVYKKAPVADSTDKDFCEFWVGQLKKYFVTSDKLDPLARKELTEGGTCKQFKKLGAEEYFFDVMSESFNELYVRIEKNDSGLWVLICGYYTTI